MSANASGGLAYEEGLLFDKSRPGRRGAELPASDVPRVDGFYQEVRATTNPLGFRGLGECGNPGLGGAIANAVCDALGRPDLPLTALPVAPARVVAALGAVA